MSAKRRAVEQSEVSAVESGNPFDANMELGNPEFKLSELVKLCKEKQQEQDKRKIGIAERVTKAKENIARIQNMIVGLEQKAQMESGQTFINMVIRPVLEELQKVFPSAAVDMSTVLSGAVTITVCRRGVNLAGKLKNADCKSVTLVPSEDGISLRDFSNDTGEYPIGSIGQISGYNYPLVSIPMDSPISFIVEWLK